MSAVSSDDAPLDAAEEARRRKLLRTRFVVRLRANGQDVGSTAEQLLGMDFVTDVPSVFSLQLRRWPDDVRLQVCVRSDEPKPSSDGALVPRCHTGARG